VDQRNRLDTLVYEVEKNVKEWGDRLDSANRDRLNAAVESARQALRSGEGAQIKAALEELSQAYSAAGASLYQASQAEQSAEAGPTDGETAQEPDQEEVVEADYEIVDDSKPQS
jgi:molecular chaperone DnaK